MELRSLGLAVEVISEEEEKPTLTEETKGAPKLETELKVSDNPIWKEVEEDNA
jgi:hypothetical protein